MTTQFLNISTDELQAAAENIDVAPDTREAITAELNRRTNATLSTQTPEVDNEPIGDQTAYCAYCLLPWHQCAGHGATTVRTSAWDRNPYPGTD